MSWLSLESHLSEYLRSFRINILQVPTKSAIYAAIDNHTGDPNSYDLVEKLCLAH